MRRLADRAATGLIATCAATVGALLLALLAYLLARALPVLDWQFLVTESRAGGAGGGVRDQLLGTLVLTLSCLLVSVPLAVGSALTIEVFVDSERWRRRLRLLLYTANGVPSILFGLFAFVLFTHWLGWGKSWLAGGIVLGLMALPTVALALGERIRALPPVYREAGRAVGLTRSQLAWSVLLPQSRAGLLSGTLLGLARAAGETAPILFAAAVFSGVALPAGVVESPVLALPYHIFVLAQDTFDPAARARLWGAAWVLVALALTFSLLALPARLASTEEGRRGGRRG